MFAAIKSASRLNLLSNFLKMQSSTIQTIASPNAPKAIGPYSQGKIVSSAANLVYTSGALGIDPSVNIIKTLLTGNFLINA